MATDQAMTDATAEVKAEASEPVITDAPPMKEEEAQSQVKAEDGGDAMQTDVLKQEDQQVAEVVPPNPMVLQYNEQLKKVNDNPSDFTAWTTLISTAEKLDELQRIRDTYEPFLSSYPLCYGYWKKYADAENRHKNVEGALAVFERGVNATPYSTDLWIHYANYKKANDGTPDDVRAIFERAVAYCGSDYVAHSLWEKYVAYEEEQGSGPHVVAVYSRALAHPLRELQRVFNSLKSYTDKKSSSDFMSPEESGPLMDSVAQHKEAAAAAAKEAAATGDGSEPPPVIDTSVADTDIKAAWLSQREAMMEAARKVADIRKAFEEAIKRPYFHVKPLDTPQLLNWVRYLDYVESQTEDIGNAVLVYERCLVPCANYPEFWMRYIRWLENRNMMAEAENAVQRALGVFCRTRPEMYLFAARYQERHNKPDAAREHYEQVLKHLAPDLIEATCAAANFEKRQGNEAAACSLWESALEREKAVTEEEGKTGSKLYPFLAIKYATFLAEACKSIDKARAILKEALAAAPHLRSVWEAAIHLEQSTGGEGMVERVVALFECACAEPPEGSHALTEKEREEMSIRFVEYADTHGDVATLLKAETAHGARFTLPSSFAAAAQAAGADAGRKRAAEAAAAEEAAVKQARTDQAGARTGAPSSPSAAAAAAAAAAAGAAAGGSVPPAYHHYPPGPGGAAAYPYPAHAYGGYAGYPPYGHYGYGY